MLAKVSRSVEGIALATRNVYGDNMIDEGNSVNIKSEGAKAAGAYHHGDLRAAVIAAGLKRLEAGDDGELGLRALARDVGVSATALYRHFPDKEALLDALADEGLRRLGARQAQAWLKAGGGRNGFKATGTTYVRFAHDEPALFRLSFTRQMSARHANVGGDGGEVAYNLLRAGVGEALPGVENPDRAALHAWALVHGLAMLILDRRLEWDEAMVDEVVGLTFGGID
jgi:AcrR family transcriptional regulator